MRFFGYASERFADSSLRLRCVQNDRMEVNLWYPLSEIATTRIDEVAVKRNLETNFESEGGNKMKEYSFAILTILLAVTVARAAEVEVLKPRGNLELKLGHPSSISLYDIPAVLTHERLNGHGWNLKNVEFTRTALNVQALAQGTIQVANSQVLDPVRAIQKGAKLFFLM
jgi:hypothetical protein